MTREARVDYPGAIHHVMVRGLERRKIFLNLADKQFLLEKLESYVVENNVRCFAWAFMPNHIHLLLQISFVPMSSFMQKLLTSYGVYFNKKHNRSGYLYQNRYKSIQCSTESYFLELLRYIHLNPVRSGSVESVGMLSSYPWTGHGALLGKVSRDWQETQSALSCFAKAEDTARIKYNNFLLEGLDKNIEEERKKFESVLALNDTEYNVADESNEQEDEAINAKEIFQFM